MVADQTYRVGTPITPLLLPAASGGNGPLTYSLAPTVPGLQFDVATRRLSGTPTEAGTHPMTYRVADGDENTADSDTAVLTFTIVVQTAQPPDTAPSFGSQMVADQTYTMGTPITPLLLPAASGGNGPLTYSFVYRLVPGLQFDAATRTLSGTPTARVRTGYQIIYRVTDGDENTADSDADVLEFTIDVLPPDSPANQFMFSCPTPAEVAAIDRELQITFIDDPTAGEPLACREDAGSVDLTVLQMGAYQTLRLMKAARFSEPLPWTSESLWDWFVAVIDGIEFDSNAVNSFCCRGGNIVISTVVKRNPAGRLVQGPSWFFAYEDRRGGGRASVSSIQLYVHEARHAEGPSHTCGVGDDATFAEMGAWAYAYYVYLWFEQKFLPAGFFDDYAQEWMSGERRYTCDRICGDDCPG